MVDQNPVVIKQLEETLDEQRASNGANTEKSHFGVAAQSWRRLQPSLQFLVVLVVGLVMPSNPACAVSLGEVTCSEVTMGCYCVLLIKMLVVCSSVCDVLWVKKCFLMSSLSLWMVIWGCSPSYHLLFPARVWPHPSSPSVPMLQLGPTHRCPQCPHG